MYELLCKDNTRAPIDNYNTCFLARVPADAVITRKDPQLADFIWETLDRVQTDHVGSPLNNISFQRILIPCVSAASLLS